MLTAHSAAFVLSQEQSASQVESGLLDQIRVVWPKLVIPVWVEKSICIFITVGMYAGMADTELLSGIGGEAISSTNEEKKRDRGGGGQLSSMKTFRRSKKSSFPVILGVLIDDRLYSAILCSLDQTHCARMWCYMSD